MTRVPSVWVVAGVAAAVVVAIATAPIFVNDWPYGHESYGNHLRVEMYRRAYAAGDLMPTWSPFSANGHGTPLPLLYHRLFLMISGALALVTGSVVALKLGLAVMMAVGLAGVIVFGKRVGTSPGVAAAMAVVLLLSRYAATDWVVRAAHAEFTAFMVLPWVMVGAYEAMEGTGRLTVLGLAFSALFHAHTLIALYTMPVVAAAVVVMLCRRTSPLRWRLGQVGLISAIGAVLVVPHALATRLTTGLFNVEPVILSFNPVNERRELVKLWDDPYPWGQQWQGLSVEVGKVLVVLVAAIVLREVIRRPAVLRRPVVVVLLCTLALSVLLQSSVGSAFFALPGPFRFIQFPWRLLVFTTVSLALLPLAVTGGLHARASWPLLAACVAIMVEQLAFSATALDVKYGRFPAADLRKLTAELDGPNSAGEYYPAGVGQPPERTPFLVNLGCARLARVDGRPVEEPRHFIDVEVEVESPGGCRIGFSQFPAFLTVKSESGAALERDRSVLSVIRFPPGLHRATIHRRSLLELLVQR